MHNLWASNCDHMGFQVRRRLVLLARQPLLLSTCFGWSVTTNTAWRVYGVPESHGLLAWEPRAV
jgi:hypothetical protein